MKIELINRLVMFVALFVAQVLILNHVHLLGVGTPLLYVYFAITFRRNFPKWLVLVSCFLLGLLIDVFSNTPGLAASTMTLVALLLTLLYCLVFFALEAFNFFDVLLWLARSVISFVLTMVLILAVESVRSR